MSRKPKVVLDTNVLLVSISSKSEYHWIFQKMLLQEFDLVISNDTLVEYEEVISRKFSPDVANHVIRTLLLLPNVIKSDIYYNWSLIVNDEDDNKFVDCAVASNADYIVTNDRHFNRLRDVEFPPLQIVDINGFRKLFPG